ncbi:MAG: RagB/SusD family nutrient uptake outer membrane protein, partial [Prevotellaceae bacterium]|nr:RagB/SusD family nutrient uptake outer membrane protein [Prevotellaceae bacterium]
MKIHKYIRTILIVGMGIAFSCSKDFLKEELITKDSTQSFETPEGLDKLATGMYKTFEFHFNYEWAYCLTNYGADEMSVGNDDTKSMWNNYNSNLNPANGSELAPLWDNMYGGISSANLLINNVPKFYNAESAGYNTRLGEGYFVRGFNYLVLVSQFGGVPLVKDVIEGPQTDFSRNTPEECYDLIVSDLKSAYDLLPPTPSETGRLTKWAAAHYLAKASLFRASEINDSWNTAYKAADLENVIKYGKEVIAAHPLCPDFVNLWDYTAPNGANEQVSEVILAAQFSNETASQGRYGNQVHLYYPSVYQNLAGLKRDISGDREFSRMRSTNYALDIYDRVNDSRFWKSFITSYRCNNPSAAPKWDSIYAPTGKTKEDSRFAGGEEAVLYIVNDAGDTRYTADNIKYRAPHMYVRYFSGESWEPIGKRGNFGYYETGDWRARFVALSKFRDGSRESIASQFGRRDGILARSAEDYLMVAEALGRQGKFDDALVYINDLRERAGYSAGEDRSKHVDGGQAYKNNSAGHSSGTGFPVYSETNTYYESNNDIPVTTDATKENLKFSSVSDIFASTREFYDLLGASSDADKFLVFILNERSRELMGELLRWPDLARTKQLEKRWKTFNDGSTVVGAAFKENTHYLRPIPQSFLDAVTKDGV